MFGRKTLQPIRNSNRTTKHPASRLGLQSVIQDY